MMIYLTIRHQLFQWPVCVCIVQLETYYLVFGKILIVCFACIHIWNSLLMLRRLKELLCLCRNMICRPLSHNLICYLLYCSMGLDLSKGIVRNNLEAGVIEPAMSKVKIIQVSNIFDLSMQQLWGCYGYTCQQFSSWICIFDVDWDIILTCLSVYWQRAIDKHISCHFVDYPFYTSECWVLAR